MVSEKLELPEALMSAYHSDTARKIENYNSSFYYDSPQNILNDYLYGEDEE